MSEELQNKDSHDEFLTFSRITKQNWLCPDRNHFPFGSSKEEWVEVFLETRLEASVPREIIQLFEIARGSMIYGWFFYPLVTQGLEQCTRIAEFAARSRCLMLSQKPGNFFENIETLAAAGVISTADAPRWQSMRGLRNSRSHLKSLMLVDPGQAAGYLRTTAELINKLFP